MDADWYVDPLGRFDGRFFDGERWTERVSDGGALVLDPDFPPDAAAEADVEALADEFVSHTPAVAPVPQGRHLQASLMEESPVRVVAVLDDGVRTLPPQDKSLSVAAPPKRRRARVLWALGALITAFAVAGIVLLTSGDGQTGAVAEPVELDSAQEARVQDLESSGVDDAEVAETIDERDVDVPPGAVPAGSTFDPAETIEVGGLRVRNGTSVLADVAAWHRDFAAERGIDLEASASCWFGQLGGAAVQVVFCGPVGGSSDTEFLFDSVQVVFEETSGGQIAQPVFDAAVTTDTVLANALTLVGPDENPYPAPSDE